MPLRRRQFRTIAIGYRIALRSERACLRARRARRPRGDRPYVQEDDARRALEECLRDEPDWVGMLYVKPIELDERDVSSN